MSDELILTGAAIVLPDAVIGGTVVVRGGVIAKVDIGRSASATALDCDGDYLLPGIVDLHTDNLERQALPRSNARWPSRSALVMHDAQCAAAGVTTVLDALCVGDLGFDEGRAQTFRDGIADLDALADTGLLKCDHFLHLRCEQPAAGVAELFDAVADHARLRMVSLMDHSPGVGQYADLRYYTNLKRREGYSPEAIAGRIAELREQRARLRGPNRRRLLARVAGRTVAIASHDDRTEDEIADNAADGIRISEFPVTLAAAEAAKRAGMDVIAGAPNVVRGVSHSGNVRAADLLLAGAVDAFASDYVPASLAEAAFLAAGPGGKPLCDAIALVSERPALIAGLHDRGRIAVGCRADLVRVRLHEGLPIVRAVWRTGERIA